MDENAKTPTPLALGKWIGVAVAAVILAEGIWGILVSLTRSLLLPLLARFLGVDPHSPLYLGSGEINVPDLFGSILQLCVAGIVFLIIKSWVAKADRVKTLRPKKIVERPVAPALPAASAAVAPMPAAAQAASASSTLPTAIPQAATPIARTEVASTGSRPAPVKPVKPEKPPKPEKPKEVYYNIVGEPLNPTEDE
jgi:hypothetical protein